MANETPSYQKPLTFTFDVWALLPDWLRGTIKSVDDFFSADERQQLEALQAIAAGYKAQMQAWQVTTFVLGGVTLVLLVVILVK